MSYSFEETQYYTTAITSAKRLRDQYRERKEAEWLANYNLERMQHYELRIKAAKDLLERMQKHKDLQVIDETSWK